MIKEKWSPYLTATNESHKSKSSQRSEIYSISKERKTISEQLKLMKIRIKQLEKEEKQARAKALNASALTDTILERRIQRNQKKQQNKELKDLKEKEILELKERNKEIKENLKARISLKKEFLLETKKTAAKTIKELLFQKKAETSKIIEKVVSHSPKRSLISSSILEEENKFVESRVEEEKDKTNEAIREMKKLEELESVLIDRLKKAYDKQKAEENKVAFLINHPVISSKNQLVNEILTKPESNEI